MHSSALYLQFIGIFVRLKQQALGTFKTVYYDRKYFFCIDVYTQYFSLIWKIISSNGDGIAGATNYTLHPKKVLF